jgi:hypothetical protein
MSVLSNRIPIGPFAVGRGEGLRCRNIPDDTAAPEAIKQPPAADGGWGNPCFWIGINHDEGADPATAPKHVKALFENTQIRMVLTNLEEYFGDALGVGISVTGGFVPELIEQTGDAFATLGTRILTGPLEIPFPDSPGYNAEQTVYTAFPYLYVVDQGRAPAGSRGQIMRINPRTGRLGTGRFDSPFTQSTFPIQ